MFGDRLKQLRESNGLTQKQLADLMHVGRPTIAGYETKGKEPDFEKIAWLSEYFNVSTDYLLGNTDTKQNTPTAKAAEVLKAKFIEHGIIKEGDDLTDEQLDAYLKKLSAIEKAFKSK